MRMHRDLRLLLIIYGVVSILPVFLHNNLPVMHILIMCLIWAVAAEAWDVMMAYAGVFTFGQVAFFVMGAYGSAILAMRFGISPWLGMWAGAGLAAGVGILIGLPCLRLRPSYVALLTFALHLLVGPLLLSDLGRAVGTGGSEGLLLIPRFAVGGYTFSPLELVPPFYAALGMSFAALFAMYKVIHSSWGLAFSAVRDSEPFAKSLGVDDFRYKLIVFGLSAFLTGIAGAFYAHYVGVLSVRILGLDLFLLLMVMQVVGGMGMFPGSVIGSFIVTFTNAYLSAVGVYRLVIFGALVVVLCVAMPAGVMGVLFPTGRVGPAERFGRFIRQTFTRRLGEEK
jgi:branched-chain amino acid transport system permease protein